MTNITNFKLDDLCLIKEINISSGKAKKTQNFCKESQQSTLNSSSNSKFISSYRINKKGLNYHLPINAKTPSNAISLDLVSKSNRTCSIEYIEDYDNKLSLILKRIPSDQEKRFATNKAKKNVRTIKDKLGILTKMEKYSNMNIFESKPSQDIVYVEQKNHSHRRYIPNLNNFESSVILDDQQLTGRSINLPQLKHCLRFNSSRYIPENDHIASKDIWDYSSINEPYIHNYEIKELDQTSKKTLESLNQKIPQKENKIRIRKPILNSKRRLNDIVKSLDKLAFPMKNILINTQETINQSTTSSKRFQIDSTVFNCKKASLSNREDSLNTASTNPIENGIFKKKEESNGNNTSVSVDVDVINESNKILKTKEIKRRDIDPENIKKIVLSPNHNQALKKYDVKKSIYTKNDTIHDLFRKRQKTFKLMYDNLYKNYDESLEKLSKSQSYIKYSYQQNKKSGLPTLFYTAKCTKDDG